MDIFIAFSEHNGHSHNIFYFILGVMEYSQNICILLYGSNAHILFFLMDILYFHNIFIVFSVCNGHILTIFLFYILDLIENFS